MQKLFFLLSILIFSKAIGASDVSPRISSLGAFYRIEADPQLGFNYPFFLYIPETDRAQMTLLVIPNNSGSSQLDFESQVRRARADVLEWSGLAEKISSALLVPAFFRPNDNPPIYTHSLSRSTLEVKSGDLKRVDLQLIKMIDVARSIIKKKESKAPYEKIFLFGFSASAMFVNRFAFIHPDIVAAVALGAPGGWPIAPVKEFMGQKLNYPVGIADLDFLTNSQVNIKKVAKIPMYLFLGENDENDSVVFRDSYTKDDENQIFSFFGKKPVKRWSIAEKIYKDAGLNATFKLYPGIGHETNKVIHDDVTKFFKSVKDGVGL
ncbi:MAG: alpha/beta hydrolase family protein [Pseudobdellovibrionaceae bacterium]